MNKHPRLLQVDHAQISVAKEDEAAAREFYCGFLGLTEIAKPEALAARGGFWLDAGSVPVHVGIEDEAERSRTTKAHIAYEVNDLEAWHEKLSIRGIIILEGIPVPGCIRFEFRDPFGNRVEFLEKL